MFDLDMAIYNGIKNTINNTINHWSTIHGIFDFMKILVITSITADGACQIIKIIRGDNNVQKAKR